MFVPDAASTVQRRVPVRILGVDIYPEAEQLDTVLRVIEMCNAVP